MIKTYKSCSKGFTLVELLVVISLVSILASVTISILNPVRQRNIAEDGVRQSNLQKYALGVEAYANANGKYPTLIEFNSYKEPTNPADLSIFISKIPDKEPTDTAIYKYEGNSDGDKFGIAVPLASDSTKCYKYHSAVGKIRECVVSTGCTTNLVIQDYACN